MYERNRSSHVEAISCETSAKLQKKTLTGTFVLQDKQEDTQHLLRCMSNNNNMVSFTYSNRVLVVNVPFLAAQQ